MTIPRSAQQNGVAEKKNKIILNMTKSMLKSKRLSKDFWAEVTAYAIYLSSKSPTKNVSDNTPQNAWSERKAGIAHLRVFRSIANEHVPDEKRVKLYDKSESSSLSTMKIILKDVSYTIQTTRIL